MRADYAELAQAMNLTGPAKQAFDKYVASRQEIAGKHFAWHEARDGKPRSQKTAVAAPRGNGGYALRKGVRAVREKFVRGIDFLIQHLVPAAQGYVGAVALDIDAHGSDILPRKSEESLPSARRAARYFAAFDQQPFVDEFAHQLGDGSRRQPRRRGNLHARKPLPAHKQGEHCFLVAAPERLQTLTSLLSHFPLPYR